MISHTPYKRRRTTEVRVGRTVIGGSNPVAVQSMTNTPTLAVEESAAQARSIADAGGEIVRLTAQTAAHAAAIGKVGELLRAGGCDVPLVADIHFNPAAAFEAALHADKVRVNPGNFELARLPELLALLRRRGAALRVGVNHGSLSRRIMDRFGDTPRGMVESALEFLRVCREHDFHDVVISIKASNVTVMTATVRLLCDAMEAEGMAYPLHLGVTEAGDAEDGRVKSAVGIGSLLADGIGDTIRVSLTEDPEREIPVARAILAHIATRAESPVEGASREVDIVPPSGAPLVAGLEPLGDDMAIVRTDHPNVIDRAVAAMPSGRKVGVVARYPASMSADEVLVAASVDLGYLLLKYPLSAIGIEAPALSADRAADLALAILQATRRRVSRTEYIACPSCGRTLFDLQSTLARVKEATSGLVGLKIAVMGCVVNGPGEMADADYGYVGAGPGRVSLYRGRECVEKNIPADEALPRLLSLIQADGRLPG